jgi:hypothetical protein
MPESEDAITFRSAIGTWIRELRTFFVTSAGSEVAAVLVMMLLVGLLTGPLALFADAPVVPNGTAPVNRCAGQVAANATTQTSNQVQVSNSAGANALDVYTGRDGAVVERVSLPLSVQNGKLPPNMCIGTVVSDLVRSDGQVIPANQVTSWGRTGNAGLRVFIYVQVSPRYGSVTPSGGYKGIVSMDDDRAIGGSIPVTVHIRYPRLWRATMVCILAAWVGFFWAWLIHLTRADIPNSGRFWLYFILQVAILTIVAFPVLNAQILTNADWTGEVTQYIALVTLAGGGALATTPTLRALIDRAAIFMPGSSSSPGNYGSLGTPDSSTTTPDSTTTTPDSTTTTADSSTTAPDSSTTDPTVPAVPTDQPADTPADVADSALTTPQGGDGSALAAPQGDGGGDAAATTTPQGGDGSALAAPQGDGGGDAAATATPQGDGGGDAAATATPPVPPAPPEQ